MAISRSLWSFWWAMASGLVTVAGLVIAGMMLLAGVLFALRDALSERRWPWLSCPLAGVAGGLLLWAIFRGVKARRRMIAAIEGRVYDCPSCEAPFPAGTAASAATPTSPIASIGSGGRPTAASGCVATDAIAMPDSTPGPMGQ